MTDHVQSVFTTLPPLSLYIHIPWCVRKCPYCDFNSHTVNDSIPEPEYLQHLQQDLLHDLPLVQNRHLRSIFFGGGTPSLMSAQFIENILSFAERRIGFTDDIEITLEANPGTVEQQKFADFKLAGINRLSIGVQSFSPQQLVQLGRIHNADEARRAAESANAAGLYNFNIDLMHGLQSQSVDAALEDLQQAIALDPQHISWYQLTIEPNTYFFKSPPELPNETVLDSIESNGMQLLEQHGFKQYEVSAFARDAMEARHNINYWQFGDYLGIGAGAHGKLTLLDEQKIIRTAKTRLPQHYMQSNRSITRQDIATDDISLEFFMNALRLNDGFSERLYEERTGLPFTNVADEFCKLQALGLVQVSVQNSLRNFGLTSKGKRFLDTVLAALAG